MPKIKIEDIDLQSFTFDQLVVEPYWDDLYNPPVKSKKKRKS